MPADTTVTGEPSGLRAPRLVGSFRLDLSSGRWTWSDAVYALHGFAPHEVVPTMELVLAHTHPDDRDDVRAALGTAPATGAFSSVHRIVTARRRELTVAVVGGAEDDRRRDEAVGYFLDLTSDVAKQASARASADIRAAATTRGVIEQAKGVLAVVYEVEIDGAFDLMRTASNDHNVAVRDLARAVVEVAHRRDVDRRAALDRVLRRG